VLFVGRLVPEKGVHYLCEAFSQIDTDMKLALVGGMSFSQDYVDLLKRYDAASLPSGLTAYVRARGGYDYHHHAEVGSANAGFVDDESVDRFCVVGEVGEQVAKLRRLEAVGVEQFNLYLMNGDEEETVETYGREVIPALRAQ